MLPQRIVLTGFRATGKTAVGQHLAQLCGWDFLDTDAALTRRLGYPIRELIKQQGWAGFREQERLLLLDVAQKENTVIATGGGAILHQQEWKLLRQAALVVWLRTDLANTLARLQQDTNTVGQRPLLNSTGDTLERETAFLLVEREPLYRAGSDLVLATTNNSPEQLAQRILQQMLEAERKKESYNCCSSL
jgi:shikimate kinase